MASDPSPGIVIRAGESATPAVVVRRFVIGSEWCPTEGREVISSINPATGHVIGAVIRARPEDVDHAAEVADKAHRCESWRRMRPDHRASLLYRIGERLLSERDSLAHLQMLDSGKPLKECLRMIDSAAGYFRYYAGICETWQNELTSPRGEYFSMTIIEPFGVVAVITPWNSPIMLDAQKVAPALAVGNAVILKPSEETPLLALELARVCTEAGLPDGLLTVLPGFGADVGNALIRHPAVRMISFTGGTVTGRAIGEVAGRRLIPASLELGGKSPHIVFGDADSDMALAGVISGIFGSAGQSCIAGTRLFVEKTIYSEFVHKLVTAARKVRVGLPDDPQTQMGPLISSAHRSKVERYIELAKSEGGRILVGGGRPTESKLTNGWFVEPTIIEGLSNKSRVCQEEIFGPVLVVLPFESEEDLVKQANDSVYGLAAGMWTSDYKRAWRIAQLLEAGSVWINTYKQSHIPTAFGGYKDSGIGRQKGLHGLRLYSQVKSIYWGLQETPPAI